jgi:hypothetical protein
MCLSRAADCCRRRRSPSVLPFVSSSVLPFVSSSVLPFVSSSVLPFVSPPYHHTTCRPPQEARSIPLPGPIGQEVRCSAAHSHFQIAGAQSSLLFWHPLLRSSKLVCEEFSASSFTSVQQVPTQKTASITNISSYSGTHPLPWKRSDFSLRAAFSGERMGDEHGAVIIFIYLILDNFVAFLQKRMKWGD